MKLICDKELLQSLVLIALKAISSRTTMPILECILLTCNEKGFSLTATDLEMGIETTPIEGAVLENGMVALPSKIFSDIVRKLPDGQVTIETDDNLVTIIQCANTEFKIVGRLGDEYPSLPAFEKTDGCRINQLAFKNMVKQTIFSVSPDELKPILMGERIDIDHGHMHIAALDGYRIAVRKAVLEESAANVGAVIPAKTLSELSKIIPDDDVLMQIWFTQKHVLFELDNCILQSRLLEGDFFNYENSFTSEYATRVQVDREALLQSLERTSLVGSMDRKHPVALNIKDGMMILSSRTELGAAVDKLEIKCMGDNLEISFNPKYLIDVARAITDDEIIMHFNSSLTPCIIKPETGDHYKYLILPLKIRN